jgi:hypothetical protein
MRPPLTPEAILDGRRIEEFSGEGARRLQEGKGQARRRQARCRSLGPGSLVLGLGFMSQTKQLSSAMWLYSSAVVMPCSCCPLGSRLSKAICNRLCASSTDCCPAPPLLRGRRRGLPGLRRTPALMARLAMWKAGGYLLPLPTLRLRARLESGEIDVYGAASRAAAVRTFHQL